MTINKGITSNPSIRLNLLKKITKDFEGYIAGLGGDNKLSTFTVDSSIKESLGKVEKTIDNTDKARRQVDNAIDKVLNTILDSSQGAFLSSDYVRLQKIYSADKEIRLIQDLGQGSANPEATISPNKRFIRSLTIFSQRALVANMKDTKPWKETPGEIMGTQVIPTVQPDLIITPTQDSKVNDKREEFIGKYTQESFQKLDTNAQNEALKGTLLSPEDAIFLLPTEAAKKEGNTNNDFEEIDPYGTFSQRRGGLGAGNKDKYDQYGDLNQMLQELPKDSGPDPDLLLPSVNINNGDKSSKLKMSAFVFCNHNVQRASRAKNVLNLFLNGIPPLEMSRCAPFLDITIYHRNNSINNKKYLNHAFHMRFTKNDASGNFELIDKADITSAKRLGRNERDESLDSSFMSVFTSPQVMSNANINKSNENIFDNFTTANKEGAADQKFLEPIVPLMSLQEFQVTIDGMGYGLVSSRKGSMSIVLHDRSRLADFAPLVSLNQLSGTSMRVEFGWSHPDGDPITSENPIGQFLNASRDVQYYNLTGTNLSFNNNSVNIEVQIASAGNEMMTGVSAAAGFYAPLNFLNKRINGLINQVITKQAAISKKTKNNDQFAKIQKELRVFRSAATSQTAVIKTADYEKIIKDFESPDEKTDLQKLSNIAKALGFVNSESSDLAELIDKINKKKEDVTAEKLKFTSTLIKKKIAAARLTTDFNPLETSTTAFQLKHFPPEGTNNDFDTIVNSNLQLQGKEVISFGKLVMYYCALPMLSTCEFADVQVMFYPINTSAGGARRFTTASLPIEYSIVRKAIDEKFKEESNMSVKGMFSFLANLFDDTGLGVYGIGDFDEFFKNYQAANNLSEEQVEAKKKEAVDDYKSKIKPNEDDDAQQKPEPELNEKQIEIIYKDYLRRKEFDINAQKNLVNIYKNDGLVSTPDEIVTPLLNMHMEVVPVIDPEIYTKTSSTLDEFFFGAVRTENNDGYVKDKKILRIHVYDARSNANIKGELLNRILNSEVAEAFAGKIPPEIKDENIIKIIKNPDKDLSSFVSKISTRELKYFVKRNYPNVTWGANSSVVKSMSVSSNTNDKVSKLIMIRRKAQERSGGASKNALSAEEEISINPSTVGLELFGCPFIDRGSQIFVDTGTGTDLDNVYTVNSITHRVKSGDFTTSLSLVLTAQGAITSTRRKLANKLKKIEVESNETVNTAKVRNKEKNGMSFTEFDGPTSTSSPL